MSARQLIQALVRAATVTKKGYVGIVRDLASHLQAVRLEGDATCAELVEQDAALSELELKAQLLAEETGPVRDLQKPLDSKTTELDSVMRDLEARSQF